jgi:hypothetical protein
MWTTRIWRRDMHLTQCLITAAAVGSLLACDRQLEPSTSDTSSPELTAGSVTGQPSQARTLLRQAKLKTIISVGDPIPGQESNPDPEQRVWAPIPDGLGAYQHGERGGGSCCT